jgi:hypothetical protein
VLKVQVNNLRQHLPTEMRSQLPATWHQVKKRCKVAGAGGISYYRHFCPTCGKLFPVNVLLDTCTRRKCGGKRFDEHGKPQQRALYYDIPDKLKRLLETG